MELYLMQHGACFSKEIDPDQPLSPVGMEQIARSAQAVKRLGLGFDVMVASPKTRALQTAEAVAQATGYPPAEIVVTEAVKAMAPPDKTVEFLRPYVEREAVFVAGHLPNLQELVSHLLCPDSRIKVGLDNGGLCRVDFTTLPARDAVLRWYLAPFHLQLVANSR